MLIKVSPKLARFYGVTVILIALTTLIMPGIVHTQDPAVCPPNALLSFVRAGAVCQGTERDQICYGNGAITADFQGNSEGLTFAAPGDVVSAVNIKSLAASTESLDEPTYSIVTGQLRADITDPEQRSVTMLLYGNAQVINEVAPVLEFPVVANGTLNIRTEPRPDADIIKQIYVRESALAHGRNAEGTWLRVTVPGTLDLGWVSAEVGVPSGNVMSLPVMGLDTPFLRPFQVMTINTSHDPALCQQPSDSGVILQSPNTENEVNLNINGLQVLLAGSVYIDTPDAGNTRFVVLNGGLNVPDLGYATAGSQLMTGEDGAVPYDREAMRALPVNNLPTRVNLPTAATAEQIAAAIDAYNRPLPTPIPIATEDPNLCRYIARRNTSVYAGPGGFFEVSGEVTAGQRLQPTVRNTDADGTLWYQLRNSAWIQAVWVTSTGECDEIPLTEFVNAPRYNTVPMETCEPTNGPLREGQIVTFEFRPPAADNFPEMRDAPLIDPGRITVENESLYVRVTEPILIASDPERWARVYSGTWEAAAGTYRIESRRLSYILICNLTVRAG